MVNGLIAESPAERRRGWLVTGAATLLALVVYAFTLADYAFPGDSAAAIAALNGLDELTLPAHPVWGAFASLFGRLPLFSSLALRMNLFSLLCGVVSVFLLTRLVRFYVMGLIQHEDVSPYAAAAADLAAGVSAIVFVFAVPVWQASTHLECRIFDVAYALALLSLFMPMTRYAKLSWAFAGAIGFLYGVGAVESAIFPPMLPLMLMFLAATLRRIGKFSFAKLGLFLLASAIGWLTCSNHAASAFAATPAAAGAGAFQIQLRCLAAQFAEMRLWVTRPGWLFVLVFGTLPFVACGFASVRALGGERQWSQYLFHLAMTVCVVLAVATPLSPMALMALSVRAGIKEVLPVATAAMSAAAAGYLAAYWYLLFAVRPDRDDATGEVEGVRAVARPLGAGVGSVFIFVVVLTVLINSFNCGRGRGRFADICANEILDGLGKRTWFVSVGMLDDHLRILANARGQELNLVCLQRDTQNAYLNRLAELVREKGLVSSKSDLGATLSLGVLPFLQDWFAGDPDIASKAAVFGVPDFWYVGGKVPVSEKLFFGAVDEVKEFDGARAYAEFCDFWKRMEPILYQDRGETLFGCGDPVTRLRLNLRRHLGFVGNNLGVTLLDLELNDEAFQLFELVRKTIDRDNVCALFNEFEMARSGVRAAKLRIGEIEREIKALVENPDKRYNLWSLSRFYGYIRSPEIFARMGYGWALSGQTGAAIHHVKRAFEFVPQDQQTGLSSVMAAIYAMGDDYAKSRETYLKVLERDGENHDALIGLARLSIQDGDMKEALEFMTRAANASKSEQASSVEWAVISLMHGDLAQARTFLQRATDLDPNDLQAWGLLSHVMLQQSAAAKDGKESARFIDELENVILPRMQTLAGGPKNYYVQVTRAMLFMRKGKEFRRDARDAAVAAWSVRPDVGTVSDMVLNLDIELNDIENARAHARRVLRLNRGNALANYVIGSLNLKNGDYDSAETFLRNSVKAAKPLAVAQNDLAEVLRRKGEFAEAERLAAAATESNPRLYVAWETLSSILLDQGKDLDRAEECMQKAVDIAKGDGIDDLRMLITLARTQVKNGNVMKARGTLRQVQSRRKELSEFDVKYLDSVASEAARAK